MLSWCVARRLRICVFWGLVALWMGLIFYGSGQVLSFQETSRYLGPFLRWLFPGISEGDLRLCMFVIRKGGHLSEYATLAILSWLAVRASRPPGRPGTFWQSGRVALAIASFYSLTDELHQALAPSRQGAWEDVLIDTAGAAAGLVLWWLATLGFDCKR